MWRIFVDKNLQSLVNSKSREDREGCKGSALKDAASTWKGKTYVNEGT